MVTVSKPDANGRVGKPESRWLESVEGDLKKIGGKVLEM
jgi:hypothetical protein